MNLRRWGSWDRKPEINSLQIEWLKLKFWMWYNYRSIEVKWQKINESMEYEWKHLSRTQIPILLIPGFLWQIATCNETVNHMYAANKTLCHTEAKLSPKYITHINPSARDFYFRSPETRPPLDARRGKLYSSFHCSSNLDLIKLRNRLTSLTYSNVHMALKRLCLSAV